MKTQFIKIESSQPLTEDQQQRLVEKLREVLNGENSDFWDVYDIMEVPTLVMVTPVEKLKLYTVYHTYTETFGSPHGDEWEFRERVLYRGLDSHAAEKAVIEYRNNESYKYGSPAHTRVEEIEP